MAEFYSTVKKSRNGALYVTIPDEIMQSHGLKPFMAGKMKFENRKMVLYDFQKTVKIKLDIDKETMAIARKIMRWEGYGSLDETIANAIRHFCEKIDGIKERIASVYIYPEGFLHSKFDLINDYEKSLGKKRRRKKVKN